MNVKTIATPILKQTKQLGKSEYLRPDALINNVEGAKETNKIIKQMVETEYFSPSSLIKEGNNEQNKVGQSINFIF